MGRGERSRQRMKRGKEEVEGVGGREGGRERNRDGEGRRGNVEKRTRKVEGCGQGKADEERGKKEKKKKKIKN